MKSYLGGLNMDIFLAFAPPITAVLLTYVHR